MLETSLVLEEIWYNIMKCRKIHAPIQEFSRGGVQTPCPPPPPPPLDLHLKSKYNPENIHPCDNGGYRVIYRNRN